MSELAEAREWDRIIRTSVRECLETWQLQSQNGPVTVEALEAILSRSMVPILRQVEDKPPDLVMALLPSLVRTMLATFVEVLDQQQRSPESATEGASVVCVTANPLHHCTNRS